MVNAICSALYVVDLLKFRETAAGDNLRVFYETLSKDPNSLSNLDQASECFHVQSSYHSTMLAHHKYLLYFVLTYLKQAIMCWF